MHRDRDPVNPTETEALPLHSVSGNDNLAGGASASG